MKTLRLNPNQIITLNDYPVHSSKVLTEYFAKCKSGKMLPLIPVMEKSIVRRYFGARLSKKFEEFETAHPKARYFMLDGSHRTTALTLACQHIQAVVYEEEEDIVKAKELSAKGQIRKSGTLNMTLEENCETLNAHFKEKPYFMTVEQKTQKMIKERKLPKSIKVK